ncbi:MAG: hypothetical protein LUG99_22675 [Lachnospiraceae bacterium]|nr:hypothetical protein [Lachnospiraceae bacterium]
MDVVLNDASTGKWVVRLHFLDFEPMDEWDMEIYLEEMEGMDARMQKMLDEEFARLESFDECIWRKSLRGNIPEDSFGGNPRGGNADTIYNILASAQQDMEQQRKEMAQQILKITKGQEKLNYVRFCIYSLPSEQADLISHVYVKREGQTAYAVEKHFSKAAMSRKKKVAMGNLLVLYNARFRQGRAGNKE